MYTNNIQMKSIISLPRFNGKGGQQMEYSLTWGTAPVAGQDGQVTPVAIASIRSPETVTVAAGT